MPILNIAELRAIATADARPPFKDVEVPQWPGTTVRIRRLSAVGLANLIDMWARLPKDEEGLANATKEDLVAFYELLIADTVVDESNMPLFANLDDRQILKSHPAALLHLGNEVHKFNDDLLVVKEEKKSEDQPPSLPSPSAEVSDSPTPTT